MAVGEIHHRICSCLLLHRHGPLHPKSVRLLLSAGPCPAWLLQLVLAARSRTKIEEVTLNALRTRQSLVKGERLVRIEVRAVLRAIARRPCSLKYENRVVGCVMASGASLLT